MISTTKSTHVVDPIVRIEAKGKTGSEDEQLAVLALLGKYDPTNVEQLPPNAEVLEALMYAHELIATAVEKYRNLLLGWTLHQARKERIPGYTDQHDVETTTDKKPADKDDKDFGGN